MACNAQSFGQVRIDLKHENRNKPEDRYRVPEANLTGTAEELEWWKSLRSAGDEVISSRGEKKRSERFRDLLSEGVAKSYSPPVEDRKPVILSKAPPKYTDEGRSRKVRGIITMRVELLPDGTIGEVTLRNSLGSGLDESAVEAARKTVFLPAIRDRKFVVYSMYIEMAFNMY